MIRQRERTSERPKERRGREGNCSERSTPLQSASRRKTPTSESGVVSSTRSQSQPIPSNFHTTCLFNRALTRAVRPSVGCCQKRILIGNLWKAASRLPPSPSFKIIFLSGAFSIRNCSRRRACAIVPHGGRTKTVKPTTTAVDSNKAKQIRRKVNGNEKKEARARTVRERRMLPLSLSP